MYQFGASLGRWMNNGNSGFYFTEDDGTGNGGRKSDEKKEEIPPKIDDKTDDKSKSDNSNTNKENAGGKSGADDDNKKSEKTNDQNQGKKSEKTFTQEELDRIVQERLERENRKKNGEFQKLYEELEPQHTRIVTENETLKGRVSELENLVNAQIDAQVKDWAPELKEMDPGKENLALRQKWAEKSAVLAAKLGGTNVVVNHENGSRQGGTPKAPIVDSYLTSVYGMPDQSKRE